MKGITMQLALILATKDLPGYNYCKPLGLGYLKSYTNIVLPEIKVDIYEDINILLRSKPDFVGISSATEDFQVAKEHIKRIQNELGVPILLGGIHISLIPETLPRGVIACIGEGEETLVELLKIFLLKGVFNIEDLSKVNGIAYYNNDHLIQTPPRQLITPLDKIPFPDRDSLVIKPGEEDTLYMFTSRGCPFKCKFCVTRKHWLRYREFSSDYVIREIELLINKYKVKHIHFFDDLFIVNRKRLEKIAEAFKEKQFKISTSCAVRANLVDHELCKFLKKININQVMFGAESFSEPILKELKAGDVTVAQNQRAIDILHENGIKTNVTMIFDAPEEKREDMIISWKAIFNNLYSGKLNNVAWGFLRPYPGSEYWNLALEKGIVNIDMDWGLFKEWYHEIFHMNENMTRREVDILIEEWETKCYLLNLHFRETPMPEYINRNTIFIKKESLIKSICAKEDKDETDIFVAKEYEKFLFKNKNKALILGEGWEPLDENSRWIRNSATFSLKSSIQKKANLLNLMFYIQDINFYKNNNLTVTLELNNNKQSTTVLNKGEYTLTVPIPPSFQYISGKITCNNSFCPAEVSDSKDTRNLSILINRFELAKDNPSNIVGRIRILKNENDALIASYTIKEKLKKNIKMLIMKLKKHKKMWIKG